MKPFRVKVCGLVSFCWRAGQLVCDDPGSHRQLALSPEAERLLRVFATWTRLSTADDVVPDGAAIARQLLQAGILVAEGSPEHRRESRLGSWTALGSAAARYHLATRIPARAPFRLSADERQQLLEKATRTPAPPPYKDYSGACLDLPPPDLPAVDLAEVMARRRTVRRLDPDRPVSPIQLSTLLHWSGGAQRTVNDDRLGTLLMKASPSAGARHPIEIYCVVRSVTGVPPGVYHYSVRHHGLSPLDGPVSAAQVVDWCGDQSYVADAAVLFFYSAVLNRVAWKYPSSRAYRTILLDLGHVSQTAYLVATALRLGAFFTGATRDESVERALALDWTSEIFLGVGGFGVPRDDEQARLDRMLAGGEPAAFCSSRDDWGER
jgi:SagB-type dehydrogenase family enzyme